jgi:hypothetical protein
MAVEEVEGVEGVMILSLTRLSPPLLLLPPLPLL